MWQQAVSSFLDTVSKATGNEVRVLELTADELWAPANEALCDASVTLWIPSGIAPSDFICCKRLGEYHWRENHSTGVGILATVDSSPAERLRRLLGPKTKAAYSGAPGGAADARNGVPNGTRCQNSRPLLPLADSFWWGAEGANCCSGFLEGIGQKFYLRSDALDAGWMELSTKSSTWPSRSVSILPMRSACALSMVAILVVRIIEGAGSPASA